MKLIRYSFHDRVHAGVVTAKGVVPVTAINAYTGSDVPDTVLGIIESGDLDPLGAAETLPAIPYYQVMPLLPYPVPPKIWCIGLNYHSHAVDIKAVQPDEPGSFMKPASCMFRPGGEIVLPPERVTNDVDAEGELAIVIGKRSQYLNDHAEALDAIFGYTVTLDLTALDVLAKNPRYLTRSKSFDTFFSFGPVIVTKDEIADVDALEVLTEHNGEVFSRDFVRNMKTRPLELVRFHSDFQTLHPGDVISTGCPKGARIKRGDRVGGSIEGVGAISATVR
ncbi:MAG: fumarylacetoacetate hydrolase family protein [Acidobacteria bacterium]|nr:fumarylacetoacetate hydrolase family protein [Acidobacteriota bacterium]